tara:strand:+ start:2964 stop:4082 length:1119 start_codon:yes stop_codon:yes gene_type:complete
MKRIIYIDYLRNLANITRCCIHASVPYMVTLAPMWPVNDKGSWFFDFAIFEGHLFVMELFFVISGFMFAMELKKSSVPKILKNRFKRIVIPFILGLIVLVPIVLSLFSLGNHVGFTFLDFDVIKTSYISGWVLGFENFFPTAHLWFLYYLIIFYILTLSLKSVIYKIKFNSIFKLTIVGVIISSICMFFMKRWIVENPLTLVPEIPSLTHFYVFFLSGFIIFNNTVLIDEIKRNLKYLLSAGLFLSLVAITPQLWFERVDLEYYFLIKVIAILFSCSSIYLLVFGLWGYCSCLNLKDSKYLRYITDASYWVYLSNMPIVVILHIILIPLNISVFLKFMIVLSVALAISMISYEYFVRYTFIGSILNKRRKRN